MDRMTGSQWMALAIVIVGIFGFSQYSSVQNKKLELEQKKVESENSDKLNQEMDQARKESEFQSCLSTAYSSYSETWRLRVDELKKKQPDKEDETLPSYLADDIEEKYLSEKESCAKLYKD